MGPHPDVTLAILAGGRGRRLGGVRKGLIAYEGRTLIARLLDHAGSFAEALLVADDPTPWASLHARVVPDLVKDRGAPGGLHSALAHARTPWVFLVACDMPFVRADVVQRLLEHRDSRFEWVCAERSGRLEPLPGVYASRLGPAIAARLGDNPSLRDILAGAVGKTLPIAAFTDLDPELRSWVNVNTPEDVARQGVALPSVGER